MPSVSPQAVLSFSGPRGVASTGVLDPVENISKWVPQKGMYRRQYAEAARREIWGHAAARCGSKTLVRVVGDVLTVSPLLCDRWSCSLCGPRRVAWLKRNVTASIPAYGLTEFWTLTTWTELCTPAESFTRVQEGWNRLRTRITQEREDFRYVWTVEATKKGYAHLHLLTNEHRSRRELSAAWRTASGGSFVVDAQPVTSTAAANYLSKYCVQQATLRQTAEWSELKGKRLFSKARVIQFEPFRQRAQESGGWAVWDHPYWDAEWRLRLAGDVLERNVSGVPGLSVRVDVPGVTAGGQFVVPQCLAV